MRPKLLWHLLKWERAQRVDKFTVRRLHDGIQQCHILDKKCRQNSDDKQDNPSRMFSARGKKNEHRGEKEGGRDGVNFKGLLGDA